MIGKTKEEREEKKRKEKKKNESKDKKICKNLIKRRQEISILSLNLIKSNENTNVNVDRPLRDKKRN